MNLCHQLRAKMRENEYLNTEVVSLKKQLHNYDKRVGQLRKENKILNKMLSKYKVEMKTKLDTLQASGQQLEFEQMMLTAVVPHALSSKP